MNTQTPEVVALCRLGEDGGDQLAGWAMVAQLWWGTRQMGEAARMDARLRKRLPAIIAASLAMRMALWGLRGLLAPMLAERHDRFLALALLVGGGAAVYGVAALALGAFRPGDLKAGMRRQR